MVNRGNAGGNDVGGFLKSLENRLVMLIAASLLGTIGGTGANLFSENVRKDPATGTQLRELAKEVSANTIANALDAQHRADSIAGYQRIRNIESMCAGFQQDISTLHSEQKMCRDRLRELIKHNH